MGGRDPEDLRSRPDGLSKMRRSDEAGKAFIFNNDLFETVKIGRTPVHFVYHFADLPGDDSG